MTGEVTSVVAAAAVIAGGPPSRAHGDREPGPVVRAEPDVWRLRRGGRRPHDPARHGRPEQVPDRHALQGVGVGAVRVAGAAVRGALRVLDRGEPGLDLQVGGVVLAPGVRRRSKSTRSGRTRSSRSRPCAWRRRGWRGRRWRRCSTTVLVLVRVVAEGAGRRVVALTDVERRARRRAWRGSRCTWRCPRWRDGARRPPSRRSGRGR